MKKRIFTIISIICILGMMIIPSYASGILDTNPIGNTPTIETFNPKLTFVTRYERVNESLQRELYDTAYDFCFPHPILWSETDENVEYDTDGTLVKYNIADVASQDDFALEEYETINGVMYGSYDVRHKQIEQTDSGQTTTYGRYIIIENFYVWGFETFTFADRSRSEISIELNKSSDIIEKADITYRSIYDETTYTETIYPDESNANFTSNYIHPNIDMLEVNDESGMMYVERMVITLNYDSAENIPAIPASEFSITCYLTGSPSIDYYMFGYITPVDGNPALNLAPFTKSIASAVAGFLSLEIYAGFTLGGIFMTTLAFICVVWWIKLVAGG